MHLFAELEKIIEKPIPFEYYTSARLWNDTHISKGMLEAHLNQNNDAASYPKVFIDKAVDWAESHFSISRETRICDFGCGPGLYTAEFAKKGAVVTGVDLSERSIKYAKDMAAQEDLSIEYMLQDYLQFSIDKTFDLITMISCDFCVLSPKQRGTLLSIFHKALSENGAILLDVDSMKRFAEAAEKFKYGFSAKSDFWSPEPYHIFEITFKYEQEKVLLEKYTLIEKDRKSEFFNWHQCYSQQSLQEVFQENGFWIEGYYSNVAGDPFEGDSAKFAVIGRKSG